MAEITIIPSLAEHVRLLGHSMRTGDAREITCLGLRPHHILFRSYRHSFLRSTIFVDGEIAAMFGLGGTPLGQVGRPWLLTSPAAETVSALTFARIYRREAKDMLRFFPVLENHVDASYRGAIRLLAMSGFKLHDPQPMGKYGALFRKFEMRA